jgi:hypothetical protein
MRTRSFVLFCVACAFPVLLGAGEGGCDRTQIGRDDPRCGDGVLDDGEACDSAVPAEASCGDQGFAGGTLACAADCTFDTSGCLDDDCTEGATTDCTCADGAQGTMACTADGWSECSCNPAGCTDGATADCLCDDGSEGVTTCAAGAWNDCSCEPTDCVDGETDACLCDDGSPGTATCSGGAWGECSCEPAACVDGETASCVCAAGMTGTMTCAGGAWGECVCGAAECTDGDTMSCFCADGAPGTMTCAGGLWGTCGGCAAAWCGDGVCSGAETEASCPFDCMTDLPVEGEHCADVGGDWLCAPGFQCQAVTDLAGVTSRFCYLAGCSSATDCAASIIEDSPVAMPDYATGLRAQCLSEIGPDGICVGYNMPFFIDEGTPATSAPIPGPTDDYMCMPCDPLSMVLPDQWFDDVVFDTPPYPVANQRCRRNCVDDGDCGEGRCIAVEDLTTSFYSCILVPTGFCCLPGDTAPGCL